MSLDSAATPSIPDDDPERTATIVSADRADIPHISLAGDTYTILLKGGDTAGRYTLIDMHVPPGGGPPPHRHDFEEMFTVLDGEIEVTFRGETTTAPAGTTVNVPANAPHSFGNHSRGPARLLCVCTPPGQEELFMEVGDLVADRTAPPPQLSEPAIAERMAKAGALAAKYATQFVEPD
ncbi:MAG: cupin domain-containing protein [Acidimicrobiales bacterium]|jgi:quercetin dioxygenase-like cupin family protein